MYIRYIVASHKFGPSVTVAVVCAHDHKSSVREPLNLHLKARSRSTAHTAQSPHAPKAAAELLLESVHSQSVHACFFF